MPAVDPNDQRLPERRLSAARIAAIYLVTGALWILFSDRLLSALSDDPALLTRLGTAKGWFYVLVTAGLLYLLIRRHEAVLLRAGELLERRVVERTRELATLLTVSHTVVSTLELEPLLDIILEQLQNVVDYASASVFIREGEEVVIGDPANPTGIVRVASIKGDRVRLAFAFPREVDVHRREVADQIIAQKPAIAGSIRPKVSS